MRLPNGDRAVIDMAKLTDYCLSETHLRGRHKAWVFAEVLGLTARNAEELAEALRAAALAGEAELGSEDEYGQRYTVDFEMSGAGRIATVRSAWIVRTGEGFPRFTSCYVLERRRR